MFENRFFDVLRYRYNIVDHVHRDEESIFEQNCRGRSLDVMRVYSLRKRVFPMHRIVRGSVVVVRGFLVVGCRGLETRCQEVVVRLCRDRCNIVIQLGFEGIWRLRRGRFCITFLVVRF